MKHHQPFWILSVAALLFAAAGASAFADLNANEIYTTFNATNGGQGFRFTRSVTSNGFTALTTQQGYSHVNVNAYLYGTTGGQDYFTTVCVEPDVMVASLGLGLLNYDSINGTSQTTLGQVLTLGAAFLYKQYATGELAVISQTDMTAFYTAIQVLMGNMTGVNWSSNAYLAYLLNRLNDRDYWLEDYKPAQSYDEIGDYCVFVMSVTDLDPSRPGNSQDYLYLARANSTSPPPIPEPATLLLWSLGSMGLVGFRVRQRRLKKPVLS
ncbi:MAG: PEP-CTERM sorting domain-containing protein [Planctomycetaceae bacterium]|nr:PEP-CTERM sorting domain-containing protein [Planctomycetaceae bacterium]